MKNTVHLFLCNNVPSKCPDQMSHAAGAGLKTLALNDISNTSATLSSKVAGDTAHGYAYHSR